VSQWPDFGLIQSYEWGKFKQALGWKVVRLAVQQDGQLVAGAQMLMKPLSLGLVSIAYIPRGPLLNWEDETVAHMLLSALHTLARRHRATSLKIEPAVRYSLEMEKCLRSFDFRRSLFNNQPQCSMLIDLSPDLGTILANMDKTTRYSSVIVRGRVWSCAKPMLPTWAPSIACSITRLSGQASLFDPANTIARSGKP
jgi:peptidoglycan pentaglycine glycine transferase (the first glycine)